MKRLRKCISLTIIFSLIFSVLPVFGSVMAADNLIPEASNNLGSRLINKSFLTAENDGYMRVYYDSSKIGIEYYDESFNIKSKKTLEMELDLWGGFYKGSDAYYIIEGCNNKDENDSAEIVRVIKYDTNWNRLAAASITGNPEVWGAEVRYPFDYGCVEATEYNGFLYIVTGHEGYVDPKYNQGHQGFMMISVDMSEMEGKIIAADLWHSFAQYIDNKDSDFYILEQSEGSRYTKLSKYIADNSGNASSETELAVLEYGGERTSAWSIPCYASVDGMALSSDNVLCVGTSIDQSDYDNVSSDTSHNVYLTITPMSDFSEKSTKVKWLTNFSGDGKSFLGLKITKITDARFMISWEESYSDYSKLNVSDMNDCLSGNTLHYLFIDGDGNKISKEFTANAAISDCQPIVNNSKIVFYSSNPNMVDFYSIDTDTGEFSKKVYRIAGENAQWNFNDGTLTISGTGAIAIDTSTNYNYPISSTGMMISGSNAWMAIRDKVEKIVIESGITSIPEAQFKNFSNLVEVQINTGLKAIEKEAFSRCEKLLKITIPSSVTEIGEDILWTGYYWTSDESHVVDATIYAPSGSYAEKYAKENNIRFVVLDLTVKGDVNTDGKFNTADVILIQKWLSNVPNTNLADWKAGDFYEDNKLNVLDLCLMKRALISNQLN